MFQPAAEVLVVEHGDGSDATTSTPTRRTETHQSG
jgi:hypothetical protein